MTALEQFLTQLENSEIDRQFAAMSEDKEYQTLNTEIAESFSESDWEAFSDGESNKS